MAEPEILAPPGKQVVAKATITIYNNGQVQLHKAIDSPNISWVAILSNMANQLNEQRLGEMAAAVNELMSKGSATRMPADFDLAKLLKKSS